MGQLYHPFPGSCKVLEEETEMEELKNWEECWTVQSSRYDNTIALISSHYL